MNGRDTFVSLPTGFGKSFIYGCLPKAFDLMLGHDSSTSSLVLVVCPLKALMKDQADAFKSLGVNAAYVGDKAVSLESFLAGSIQLIFISPESLRKGSLWRDILKSETYQKHLVAIVVDEAHLIKSWGEEYRPEFA
jgi:superfamily II DNA helicase RecQ